MKVFEPADGSSRRLPHRLTWSCSTPSPWSSCGDSGSSRSAHLSDERIRQRSGAESSCSPESRKIVECDVQTDRPTHLFISTTYYPGWSADVNGAPVDLTPAALFMTALAVPAGHSHVVLRYAPGSVTLGLNLTILGFILTLSTAWVIGHGRGYPCGNPTG